MSLRTLFASTLIGVLSLSPLTPVASAAASFSDVLSTYPNAEAIAYVKAEGIVDGYADGTFRPNQTINRAEFTKIILEATQERASCASASKTFSDVQSDAWYALYVCRGKELGVIGGYANGTFRPGSAINFAEAAKIIAQAQGLSISVDASVWYRGSVEALGERKAIPVSIDSFEKKLTRGEMAEMIWRLKAGITTKTSRTYEEFAPKDSAQTSDHIDWQTYTNTKYRFRMSYPADSGLLSNTYATEPERAENLVLGPLDIDILDRASWSKSPDYQSTYKQYFTMSAGDYAGAVQQMNVNDDNPYTQNKTVGTLEEVTAAGRASYRFWVTASFTDVRGGWTLDQKTFFEYFDVNGTIYGFSYTEANQAQARHMLNTFQQY